jgi:glycosyltransferase involved in cell wall biosynthesis
METKTKVLMLHRIFASYRKPIYDKLAEKFDYLLLHGDKDKTINQSVTPYSKVIPSFQFNSNPTNVFFESFSTLFKFKPQVFIHELAIGMLTMLPMYICCKLMGVKFILYSHGYNRLHGFHPPSSWADKYRIFLMKIADATVIYTHKDRKMLGEYANINKIFVAQNTLDTTHLKVIKNELEKEGKTQIKQRLGLTHTYNLTFIGRIIDEKMPEKILDVFDILNQKMPNQIGVHFVGGGDVEDMKRTVEAKKWDKDVLFHGAIYDDLRTGEFLYASDMMVIPGSLGLAINHAFMFDCPIISFDKCGKIPFHGPELDYVVENETGFLIPDFSVEKMAQKIMDYLQNEPLQMDMKKHIQDKMDNQLTIANMVLGFTDAVAFALRKSKRVDIVSPNLHKVA